MENNNSWDDNNSLNSNNNSMENDNIDSMGNNSNNDSVESNNIDTKENNNNSYVEGSTDKYAGGSSTDFMESNKTIYKETSSNNSMGGSSNNSWGSGVKFVEEKKPKKFMKLLSLILVVLFSATAGGVLGGYYVKRNIDQQIYTPSVTNDSGSTSSVSNLSTDSNSVNLPESPVTKVAEEVGPAVVGINNNITTGQGVVPEGSGSGIIFDSNGDIVTNEHVIDGATNVTVTLPGKTDPIPARIIGKDVNSDLAVIRINVKNLPVAKFGDSSKVRVGDVAVAIGNPLGEEYAGTVTAGVISGVNRVMDVDGKTYHLIQTDASINPGNSGGALCNAAGEVIGINTLKNEDAEGMGFAIPINVAKPIIQELLKYGYVSRPFIGISYQFIDQNMSKDYNVPVGADIQQVVAGSGAEAAGIKPGDVMVAFGGKSLQTQDDLANILATYKIGDVVPAKIWRNGSYITVNIKIGDSNGN